MNISDLLASLASGKGLNITPGNPAMDLTQLVSQIGQGSPQAAMPMVPSVPAPQQALPGAPVGAMNLDPQAQASNAAQTGGGYMSLGAGLQGNLPRTPQPPPETELTAPKSTSPMATGSIAPQSGSPTSSPPMALGSPQAAAPDFSPSFGQGLINVGNALQGKGVVDLNEQALAKNQTYKALIGRGLDPATAEAAIRNPAMLQAILPAVFNPTKSMTDDQREYEMARSQGFKGGFLDYLTTVKRAGSPQFSVTTDMRAENAEAKGRGEGLAKRFNTIADDGIEANKDWTTLQRLSQLTSNVDPGTKTALFEEIRNATGITLDPNTDNVQAFKAAVSYLAPRMRVPGSGASSDRDVSLFMKALPSLLGTPGGNQMAIETLGGMAEQRMRRADIAAKWQRGEINASQADQEMKALPDPFASFKDRTPSMNQPQAGDLPTLTPEQAARAAPGTRFKDTSGKVRVRQ